MTVQMPVLFETSGNVATITLNRPERRNAVNAELTAALGAAIDRLEADPALSVGILRGNGPVFCAGMDLGAFLAGEADPILFGPSGFAGLVKRQRTKPLIAAVHGAALAGGFEIMLACDLVVSTPDCRFGLPEAKLGLLAGGGGALRLAGQLPRAAAAEILLLGGLFGADRAIQLGLINRIVESEGILATAHDLATQLAANAPTAIEAALCLIDTATHSPSALTWQNSDNQLKNLLATEDAHEGATAFIEKRPPAWTSR